MQPETLAKAYILTHGVVFTAAALHHASANGAKGQNLVYNAPATDCETFRPQEILLTAPDGYATCASAVAPVPNREPARIDCVDGTLHIATPSADISRIDQLGIRYVAEPAYYRLTSKAGRSLTRMVSACGVDELNIWPWHDCAIGRTCTFCGINKVQGLVGWSLDPIHSLKWRAEPSAQQVWTAIKAEVLEEIVEAVRVAKDDPCYAEHLHLILISGNLAGHQLDDQARIYADIAAALRQFSPRFTEGVIAVTAPPNNLSLLELMRDAGITTIVLNLEAFTPEAFRRHCPGKHAIGRDHHIRALEQSVRVFGWGRSWCNFVLGLEDADALLQGCEWLAARGISPGANVLHVDHGASGDLVPPEYPTVLRLYRDLASIYRTHNHRPYYCSRALRTSLSNEAYDGRLLP